MLYPDWDEPNGVLEEPFCETCYYRDGIEATLDHLYHTVYRCPHCRARWEVRDGEHYEFGWGIHRGRISDEGARWLWDAQQEWVRSLCYRPTKSSIEKKRDARSMKHVPWLEEPEDVLWGNGAC